MTEYTKCPREGCKRYAKVDEFCSTYCAKVVNGVIKNEPAHVLRYRDRKERKEARKPNEDAMTLAIGSGWGTKSVNRRRFDK